MATVGAIGWASRLRLSERQVVAMVHDCGGELSGWNWERHMERMSECQLEMPQNARLRMPLHASEDMPNRMPERMPEDMSNRRQVCMPNRVPNNMLNSLLFTNGLSGFTFFPTAVNYEKCLLMVNHGVHNDYSYDRGSNNQE